MDTINVTLVQSHLHWENPEANLSSFGEKLNEIPSTTDLVVLPEMFTTGFTMTPHHMAVSEGPKSLDWMKHWAVEKGIAICGSVVFNEKSENYNRLFFVFPNGSLEIYDKKHTFTLAGEDQVYKAGTKKKIIDYKGFKICPLICYDLRFPVWARNIEDYDVLLYVANWPKPRINAWDTLLKARAIENMSYCIGVNRVGLDALGHEYVGHSAVYDVLGEQLAFSEKEEMLHVTLSKEHITSKRNKLKFLNDRDSFNLL